jgi:hypothetical protein
MKRYLVVYGIVTSLLLSNRLFSQQVNYPTDSLDKILLNTWVMEYADMGGMKITAKQGAPMIIIEFLPAGKAKVSSTDGKAGENRTWKYNTQGHFISVMNGKTESLRIMSVSPSEITLKMMNAQNAPPGAGDIKFVLKPRNKKG